MSYAVFCPVCKPEKFVNWTEVEKLGWAFSDRCHMTCLGNHPYQSHVWCGGPLNACIYCEVFFGMPESAKACDRSKNSGEMESCCECGDEYPRHELMNGDVFCAACRCKTPPAGWRCTRGHGHMGPCAAIPIVAV